jgi:hypothetical protein
MPARPSGAILEFTSEKGRTMQVSTRDLRFYHGTASANR